MLKNKEMPLLIIDFHLCIKSFWTCEKGKNTIKMNVLWDFNQGEDDRLEK